MSTPVIGVTGTIGTGKSTFAETLTSQQGTHLDADDIAKDLMRPGHEGYDPVVEEFGKSILDEDGFLRPDKLAEEVFSDTDKLSKLESILHPLVIDKLAEKIEQSDSSFYVIEAPLLFESGADELCDWVVTVTAPEEIVNRRLKDRPLSDEDIKRRRERQLDQSEKARRADQVIDNRGSLNDLKEQARQLEQKILDRNLVGGEETYDT
ncbi:MAG: dephospho-CoA kinase [bacterium]